MTQKNLPLREGTKVQYYQDDVLKGVGKITGRDSKNGRAVYDVTLSNGATHWGYREQFTVVTKK